MSKLQRIYKMLATSRGQIPYAIFRNLTRFGLTKWMPDKLYIEIMYRLAMGKKLDLSNPLTYNEKLQWLKLYDRNPDYVMMVDKYRVRKYIAGKIGKEHLIPLIGVWQRAEDIDFDKLPNQFVLKCNHDSGSIVICTDKNKFDKKLAIRKLSKALKTSGYWYGREWPYKNVLPCVIAEKYMFDDSGVELKDYKFLCFNGKHRCTLTGTERFKESGVKITFFDLDWNKLPFEQHDPASKEDIPKPVNYDEMKKFAEILSKDIPYARIDFYEVSGKTYFGEITFYPGSGILEFTPESWDRTLGDWLKLPPKDSLYSSDSSDWGK